MISSTENIVYKLPHRLQNDLRLSILGNYEMLETSEKWVEAEPSTQALLQKWSKITQK